jgi:hypothetical protein
MLKRLVLFILLLPSCSQSAVTGLGRPLTPGARHVLFIGNSLTYFNDLPLILAAVAEAAGDTELDARQVAYPDFALEDHWNDGTAVRALQENKWDFVIMQQGPSSLPENQIFLRDWAVKFAPLIRAADATPALYMVWPSLARAADFPAVRTSYANAAIAVNGLFLPAGQAWLKAWAKDPALQLYAGDGFHPSLLGTLLAAYTIYEGITGTSVVGLPGPSHIPVATLKMLQDAAHEAVAEAKAGSQ